MLNILKKSYVKIDKSEWEEIKNIIKEREDEIKALKIELNEIKSTDLYKELEEYKKYKAQDDLLYHYEQTVEEFKEKNKNLEKENIELKKNLEAYKKAFKSERELNSFLLKRLTSYEDCTSIPEVSILDLKA